MLRRDKRYFSWVEVRLKHKNDRFCLHNFLDLNLADLNVFSTFVVSIVLQCKKLISTAGISEAVFHANPTSNTGLNVAIAAIINP